MTPLVRSSALEPNEHYERYIRFTTADFELIDFVFAAGELDRIVQTSESFAEDLLPTLYSLETHPHMLNHIQNLGFEFVERVTYTEQEMSKTRAKMLWLRQKRG